eukprot:CAMPEP_0181345548 /NCGR_PEP_ID=MMETSP1101-20121128/32808_1 /TAXON_ID=46948 /ORGANISM="Rhodomonas abbreviata, Strain Caron Lab Isolate" /LENGTH=237 /DNA_ID=CAMNT_0023457511 /DNA_START=133 /DNA_END=841 /DNA_ORIENTATION=-
MALQQLQLQLEKPANAAKDGKGKSPLKRGGGAGGRPKKSGRGRQQAGEKVKATVGAKRGREDNEEDNDAVQDVNSGEEPEVDLDGEEIQEGGDDDTVSGRGMGWAQGTTLSKHHKAKILKAMKGRIVQQKKEIVQLHDAKGPEHRTNQQLADTYNVSRRSIVKIVNAESRAKMTKFIEVGSSVKTCRMRDDPHPELTKRLIAWINMCEARFQTCPTAEFTVNYKAIQSKAETFAHEL